MSLRWSLTPQGNPSASTYRKKFGVPWVCKAASHGNSAARVRNEVFGQHLFLDSRRKAFLLITSAKPSTVMPRIHLCQVAFRLLQHRPYFWEHIQCSLASSVKQIRHGTGLEQPYSSIKFGQDKHRGLTTRFYRGYSCLLQVVDCGGACLHDQPGY